jgi:ABC-type lipoprotein release transport system permease subunit
MGSFDRLKLVAMIAARNLGAHRSKNAVIGAILFFGTFLVVFGSALLESIERAMTKSITQSIAGHLHAYSKSATDPIALFGGGLSGQEDIGHIDDFAPVKAAIMGEPNVLAAVPMGLDSAFINAGNEIDRILETLRDASHRHDAARMARHRGQIEEIARLLNTELDHTVELSGTSSEVDAKKGELARILSGEIWAELERDPEKGLEFLDTRIAPMLDEGRTIPVRYIGTDLDAFAEHFDRFEIVDGEEVPPGHRGFLLNKRYADEVLKHKVARDFDAIQRERGSSKARIAGNPLLEGRARKLSRLYRSIALQLDADEVARLTPILEAELPSHKGEPIAKLLQAFLSVDDESFDRRYALFYQHIAPMIELYDVRVGDTVAVRTFTRSGQLRSVNVKVYGTFRFRGLDRSDLAGGHNLMDLMSFRDLYDLMTEEKRREIEALRRKVVEVKSSADADNAFFGSDDAIAAVQQDAGAKSAFDAIDGAVLSHERERRAKLENESYDRATIEKGVVLDIAILLKDPSKLEETREVLAKRLAPLGVQVVTWQRAAGMVGQFLVLVRLVLYFAAGIIFFVGLVIINNSMLLATMERVNEIGTLLAIGAEESFVLLMFLLETSVLGLVAGGLGGLFAVLLVAAFGKTGIHASNNVLAFLFSGSDLYPTVSLGHFVVGLEVILLVSVLSAMYPAFVATRISPRVAMEAKE